MIYSSVKLFITWLGHSPAIESVIVWLYIEVHHQMKLSWTRNANNQRMFYPQCYSNCNIGLGNSLDFRKCLNSGTLYILGHVSMVSICPENWECTAILHQMDLP